MIWPKRASSEAAADVDAEQLAHVAQEKAAFFLQSSQTLLGFLKAFAADIKELHVDRFKEDVDQVSTQFDSNEKIRRIDLFFERQKGKLAAFIEQQQRYLADRDQELRDIIELLARAMANLSTENREFYQRVYDQSEKIEQINRLDDIKRIKNALKREVDQIRDMVQQKQGQDKHHINLLASQVDILREELAKAKAKSMTDGLTGVYNRAAFDESLEDQIRHSQMSNNPFSLLMLDIDNFKSINDTHGHPIGDRVLIALAKKCRDAIRGNDLLARYGGEEFAIILEGAALRDALKKARYICENVASARYAVSQGEETGTLSMTVSIGVAAYKSGDSPEAIISRADKALYDAKHKGKNRAVARKS